MVTKITGAVIASMAVSSVFAANYEIKSKIGLTGPVQHETCQLVIEKGLFGNSLESRIGRSERRAIEKKGYQIVSRPQNTNSKYLEMNFNVDSTLSNYSNRTVGLSYDVHLVTNSVPYYQGVGGLTFITKDKDSSIQKGIASAILDTLPNCQAGESRAHNAANVNQIKDRSAEPRPENLSSSSDWLYEVINPVHPSLGIPMIHNSPRQICAAFGLNEYLSKKTTTFEFTYQRTAMTSRFVYNIEGMGNDLSGAPSISDRNVMNMSDYTYPSAKPLMIINNVYCTSRQPITKLEMGEDSGRFISINQIERVSASAAFDGKSIPVSYSFGSEVVKFCKLNGFKNALGGTVESSPLGYKGGDIIGVITSDGVEASKIGANIVGQTNELKSVICFN